MKIKLIRFAPLGILVLPLFASAAIVTPWFTDSIVNIQRVLTGLVPLLIGLAVVVFLWGVVKFVTAAGDEEKRKEGKNFIIWGLVGITVMVILWAIVFLLVSWIGLTTGIARPTYPSI